MVQVTGCSNHLQYNIVHFYFHYSSLKGEDYLINFEFWLLIALFIEVVTLK